MTTTRRVLITGASSGFGHGAALELARRNHTVFAAMRATQGHNAVIAQAMQSLAADNGWALRVLEVDVTDDASVAAAVASVKGTAGGLDVLVNNAGAAMVGIQETVTLAQAQRVFDVNVFGPLRMNRAVLPLMREQGDGLILYISSGSGRLVLPFVGLYTASKFALEALAETASYELKPLGIDSLIVQPGAYDTRFGTADGVMGEDAARAQAYGPVLATFEGMMAGVREQQRPDPKEVIDLIVAAVEGNGEGQELRVAVGADVQQPVEAINQTAEKVQRQLLSAFGMA